MKIMMMMKDMDINMNTPMKCHMTTIMTITKDIEADVLGKKKN